MPTIEQAKSLRLRRMVGSRAAACTDICSHNSNLFQLSTSIPQNIRIGFFNPRLGVPYSFLFFSITEDIKARDGSTRTEKAITCMSSAKFTADRPKATRAAEPTAATIVRLKAFVEGHRWPLSLLRGSGNIADTSLWAEDGRPSVQSEYERARIQFEQADKTGGSQFRGVLRIRESLHAGHLPNEHGERLPQTSISEDRPNLRAAYRWRLARDPKKSETRKTSRLSTVDHGPMTGAKMFLTREEPQNVSSGSRCTPTTHPPARTGAGTIGGSMRARKDERSRRIDSASDDHRRRLKASSRAARRQSQRRGLPEFTAESLSPSAFFAGVGSRRRPRSDPP